MDLVMAAVERGWVPDPLIRAGIRRLLARKLVDESRGGAEAARSRRAERLEVMRRSAVALHTRDANDQHYELPPEFFQTVLGPRLKYSCALFEHPGTTLEQAEEAMLALTSERARLADGQRVLELGCGWGSWSLWMAERFPRSTITAVSNSAPQRAFIEGRAAARGLANLQVVTADMNQFEAAAGYDRVVSVEMFEHMRNWPELMRRISTWLAPRGELFLHVFCHREHPYFYEVDGQSDWMARYFFTGGLMPSEDLIRDCSEGLTLEEQWRVNGRHYARTLRAWLARQDAARTDLMPLFARVYGTEAGRWFERWRVFFLACAELFDYSDGEEWFVTHARLSRTRG